MIVNSERCMVSTYDRKYDCARSPASCQSWRRQSVDVVGLGGLVVRMPMRTSGRSTRYVLLAITTAGRTLVSTAPASTPTTTSPGFNAFGVIELTGRHSPGRQAVINDGRDIGVGALRDAHDDSGCELSAVSIAALTNRTATRSEEHT